MEATEWWFDRLARGLWEGVRRACQGGTHRYRRFGYLEPTQDGIAGAAGWDGTLWVHRRQPAFLAKLFQERGRGWSVGDLREAVGMLETLTHEAFHHVVPRDAEVAADRRAYGRFSGMALEEGVTEAATRRTLPRLLRELEPSVPGVTRGLSGREEVYRNYVPAVEEMVRGIQSLPGMRGRDVLMELARESPATKLPVLTRLYLEGSGLDAGFSTRGREECCRRMGEALRKLYEAPETRAWAEPPDPRYPSLVNSKDPAGRSHLLGMQALVELEWESSLGREREGLPMPENWRVTMAERVVEAARGAVKWSAAKHEETHDAALNWLTEAVEDEDVALASEASRVQSKPPALQQGVGFQVNRWIRRQRDRHGARRPIGHSAVWEREVG